MALLVLFQFSANFHKKNPLNIIEKHMHTLYSIITVFLMVTYTFTIKSMQNFFHISVSLPIYKGTYVAKFPISVAHTYTGNNTRQLPDEGARSGDR
jgi:hypothetical protein